MLTQLYNYVQLLAIPGLPSVRLWAHWQVLIITGSGNQRTTCEKANNHSNIFKYWTPVMYAHHVFAPASSTFSKHLEHRSHHLNRQNIIQHHTLTTTINHYNKIQHHGHHLSLNPDVLSCPQGQEWQLYSFGLANGVYRCLHGRAKETKPR